MTLHGLLRQRALRTPERVAHTFVSGGPSGQRHHHTYAELHRRASTIAATLVQRAAPGDRALLLYPPGLDYISAFFGCLYAGVIAVPVFPPHPARLARSLPRLLALINDATPRLCLSTSVIHDNLCAALELPPTLEWVFTESLSPGTKEVERESPEGIAFLQYTSGSTAQPRGVKLSHANLLHNLECIAQRFGSSPQSQGVIWLPPYHDMGLIGGILQPVFSGFPVTLMSPLEFMAHPLRWLELVSSEGATISGGPNFAFALCARRAQQHGVQGLDLSRWEVAFNGSESVRCDTLQHFSRVFAPHGFRPAAHYPCYGLAEATLMVTGGDLHKPPHSLHISASALEEEGRILRGDDRCIVACGEPVEGTELRIVEPEIPVEAAPERVGEIWLRGPGVAQGYWGDGASHTFDQALEDHGRGWLKTGDLGWMQDGQLCVAGRCKDLVIIAGRNVFPLDIEACVEASHPAIRPGCSAAFATEADGRERLVIVAELRRLPNLDSGELKRTIRRAVSQAQGLRPHRIWLLQPGEIPKTSSGKIIRHLCRERYG